MQIKTVGDKIAEARRKVGLTQQQLAERLCVTNKAVSKWERGASLPDVALLVPLSRILGYSVQQLLDNSANGGSDFPDDPSQRGCVVNENNRKEEQYMIQQKFHQLYIDYNDCWSSSPYIFGHNLEHTRACVSGGLSAQILRNRKFAGRPAARLGVSSEWFGIGKRAFFCNDQNPYVRHYAKSKMWRRNELNAQTVQNPIAGQTVGIGQSGLYLQNANSYVIAIVARVSRPVQMTVSLTDRLGNAVYAKKQIMMDGDEWNRYETILTASDDDAEGCVRFTFDEQASVIFGAVSMLPSEHFHGMRQDVVRLLKNMGVGILRWPGGNFAGEYRWQDMFLPVDQRAPLQAYMEDETQPYTHGYDMHEIDTDDFIALCREIGAEPYITLNLAWDSPEECAAWVEYCNGPADSKYGSLRAQRGHKEPYNVKYWSLGNEIGHGHMEGPMLPENYAALCLSIANAILQVSPDLQICTSGPFIINSRGQNWIENSAKVLAPVAPYISFHTYNGIRHDYTSSDAIRSTYMDAVAAVENNRTELQAQRSSTPDNIHISYDEWNTWAEWFRSSNAIQGMYTANMLHMLVYECHKLDVPIVCYFQPVGEGAIDVFPDRAEFSAGGQVFSLLKVHSGAKICRIDGACGYETVASVNHDILSISLINSDYDNSTIFSFNRCGSIQSSKMLVASDLMPNSRMEERELPIEMTSDIVRVELPPRTVGLLRFTL